MGDVFAGLLIARVTPVDTAVQGQLVIEIMAAGNLEAGHTRIRDVIGTPGKARGIGRIGCPGDAVLQPGPVERHFEPGIHTRSPGEAHFRRARTLGIKVRIAGEGIIQIVERRCAEARAPGSAQRQIRVHVIGSAEIVGQRIAELLVIVIANPAIEVPGIPFQRILTKDGRQVARCLGIGAGIGGDALVVVFAAKQEGVIEATGFQVLFRAGQNAGAAGYVVLCPGCPVTKVLGLVEPLRGLDGGRPVVAVIDPHAGLAGKDSRIGLVTAPGGIELAATAREQAVCIDLAPNRISSPAQSSLRHAGSRRHRAQDR